MSPSLEWGQGRRWREAPSRDELAKEIALVLRHRPPEFERMLRAMSDENGIDDLEYHVASAYVRTLHPNPRTSPLGEEAA